MKLKFTPRVYHLVIFAVAAAALVLQYATGALQNGTPITIASAWAATGSAIVALFVHNVMQPDDSTRNPGLMKTKTVPPPPMSDSGEDTKLKSVSHVQVFAVFAALLVVACIACAPLQTAANAVINLADAECALAADQGAAEPNDEVVTCEVLDVTGKVIQSFLLQVPATQAGDLLTSHPIKQGHMLPAGAAK